MSCVINELTQSCKALLNPPKENPLDLRITNFAIALFGSATLLIIAPFISTSLINYGIQLSSFPTTSILPLNFNSLIVDLKEIVENNSRLAELAIASSQVQTALLVLLVAGSVLGALVAYRHYKHPDFYNVQS